MYRRLVCAITILLVLCLAGSATASLVAQWKLDDGTGTTAKDSVGTIDGTLVGGPVWVKGAKDGALQFDGVNDCVDLGTNLLFDPTGSFSVALWINIGAWGTEWAHSPIGSQEDSRGWCIRRFGSWWASQNGAVWTQPTNALAFTIPGALNNGIQDLPSNTAPPLNEWLHVVCVYDKANNMKYIYFNGKEDASMATSGDMVAANTKMYIGAISNTSNSGIDNAFTGMIDDVRLYNHALSAANAKAVFEGTDTQTAVNPKPADKATDVLRGTALSWTPGPVAKTHNVYFGTSFDDVNTASVGSPLCVSASQDANMYQPPALLTLGQTYYWRIDEVNAPPTESTVFKGKTWTFTVEPVTYKVTGIYATASSTLAGSSPGKTVDNSGISADDLGSMDTAGMWMTIKNPTTPVWIEYDLGQVYKLAEMWVWNFNAQFEWALNVGFKNVTVEYSADGTTWTKLGDFEFAQGPSTDDQPHDTTVAFGGVAAKKVRLTANSNYGGSQYALSEVRFLYLPVQAREPQPASGTTGVKPDVALSWRAGREAVSHSLYIGTDLNALSLAGSSNVATYTPSGLGLSTKYYWRVDEVNTAEAISTWASSVWNFTTADYVTIDDMESYNDVDKKVFETWTDGYSSPSTNGCIIGYDQAAGGTFNDTTTVHSGKQSMPFSFSNSTAPMSEAKLAFATAQDWSLYGIKTLSLWFYGASTNSAVQLYVTVNNTQILYNGSADSLQRARWNQWNVDLSTVPAATLKSVSSLTIGVSGAGTGKLLIDDVRLYKSAPTIPVAANPGTTNLVAYYAFNNDVKDGSGGGNDGVLVGAPTFATGLTGYGTALQLNGTADAVNLGAGKSAFNPADSLSVSLWANIGAWATAWGNVMISNRGESSMGWQVRRNSNNALCFTTRGTGSEDTASTANPTLNQWIHIACVFDSVAKTKTIYINGVQDTQVTTTGTKITATTVNTYIGGRDSGAKTLDTTTLFTGMLDEIRVYQRALTAGEVEFLSDPTP